MHPGRDRPAGVLAQGVTALTTPAVTATRRPRTPRAGLEHRAPASNTARRPRAPLRSVAMPRVLVLSTVHQAEDPRIRRRTVAVLAREHAVRYMTPPPEPTAADDVEWRPLPGSRPARWGRALAASLRGDVDLVSLHDPETIPIGLAARVLRRRPVVFDVHEDVPGQLRTKPWLPAPLRAPLAWLAAALLRVAERSFTITLAEPNYRHLFRRDHPVLPNYPEPDGLPDPQPSDGSVVYVGDITEARGAALAVEAVGALPAPRPPLRLIGRVRPELARRLAARAADLGVELDLPGFVPHPDAMAAAAGAAVGLSPLADTPNYRHSLPTKTLEYLAVGIPVLASDLPGTAEVLAGRPGVRLLAPSDVVAWRDALADVLADRTARDRAREGVDDVRARFRWPAPELRAVYAEALAHTRRPRSGRR